MRLHPITGHLRSLAMSLFDTVRMTLCLPFTGKNYVPILYHLQDMLLLIKNLKFNYPTYIWCTRWVDSTEFSPNSLKSIKQKSLAYYAALFS